MTKMTNEPDGFEKGVRFGCGALFGLFAGFLLILRVTGLSSALAGSVVVALTFGWLAMRRGDDFWGWLRHLFWIS